MRAFKIQIDIFYKTGNDNPRHRVRLMYDLRGYVFPTNDKAVTKPGPLQQGIDDGDQKMECITVGQVVEGAVEEQNRFVGRYSIQIPKSLRSLFPFLRRRRLPAFRAVKHGQAPCR